MAGELGVAVLGVWPLGFTSLPEDQVSGLIQIDGPETIALTGAIPAYLSHIETLAAEPFAMSSVAPEWFAHSATQPLDPFAMSEADPDEPFALIETGVAA